MGNTFQGKHKTPRDSSHHSPSFTPTLAIIPVQLPFPRRRTAHQRALGPAGAARLARVVVVVHGALDPAVLARLTGPGGEAGRGRAGRVRGVEAVAAAAGGVGEAAGVGGVVMVLAGQAGGLGCDGDGCRPGDGAWYRHGVCCVCVRAGR